MSPNRRQTRGVLWDVIAPWVRWPLHSPRRLFTVVAGIVVLMVLWHQATAAVPTTESSASAAATVTTTPETSWPADGAPTPDGPAPALASGTLPGTSPSASGGTVPVGGSPTGTTGLVDPVDPADPADPAVPDGSAEAAQGFVTAWARPSLPAAQWLSGVRGYVVPELEQSMSYTDPAQIDATTVTGPARMVHVLPDGSVASFEVPTDAGTTRVELALVKGRWLATDFVPASSAAPGD